MKRNALPCLVLAAVMASSSVPSVYAEETVNDTVSAQGPEDAADTETPSDAPETDATGSDDNTNHAPSTPEGDGEQNQDHEKEDTTEVPSVETPEETPVVPPIEEGEGTTVPSDDVKDEEEKQEEAEEKEEVKEEETEEEKTVLSLTAVDSTSTISVRIHMDYPLTKETVEKQNIQMSVSNAYTREEVPAAISIAYLDETGNECGNDDLVAAIDIVASDLPAGTADSVYRIAVTGDGYRTYTYNELSLEEYAKIITIGTKESTFTLGDVNGDGSVNQEDQQLVEAALGTDNDAYDLNKDGTVNIVDISYVNRGMMVQGTGKAVAQNGAMVSRAIVQNIDVDKTDLSEVEIADDKNIADLFTETEAITFSKKDSGEISPETPLEIPIAFNEGVAMSEVQIATPANGGIEYFNLVLEVEEDGKVVTETIPYGKLTVAARSARDGENVLVVNLGSRKVVKKITIQVTKTEDNETAVIKQVAFVESTLAKAPEAEAAKPQNVTATAGTKSVSLSWDAMANVTGYKVYYGTTQNGMTQVQTTGNNRITISGLENLKKYYFVVVGTSGEWESATSAMVSATPFPDSRPVAPTTLQVTSMDSALRFSWAKSENAMGYLVYYREKGTDQWISSDVGDNNSLTVGNLTNGVTYEFCVEAYNQAGVSPRSELAEGAPKSQTINGPALPTENRISNELITVRSDSGAAGNVNWNETPNFNIKHVLDGNYSTFWQSGAYWKDQSFTFDFAEPQSMNYMIYVPRQGDLSYTTGMRDYSVTTYRKTADGKYEKIATINANITAKVTKDGTGYLVLELPESNDISRVRVNVGQWEGAKAVTLSEAAFYHLDNTPAEIADLFSNGTFTELKYSKEETLEKVEALRSRVENTNAFYLNKDMMLRELNDAKALAEGNELAVQTGFQSRSTAADSAYGQTASVLQPLGVVASSGSDVVIYADIPAGETVTIVPTQYYGNHNAWKGKGIQLQSGRNVISVEQIASVSSEKGGALYLTYSGSHADEISLRIITDNNTSVKTPMLELSDWYELSESARKEKISAYVAEVNAYVQANSNRLGQTSIRNHTDIATPSFLLSIPVKEVANGLTTESLYNAILAWEDVSYVVNTTQGIVDGDKDAYQYPMESRQNIRYMRMFGSAFMYAAGDHIGIGYGSAGDLAKGTPVSMLSGEADTNGLYGWGIAHEIGHNMDKLGRTEITNNLYSLMVQSYDGGDMTSLTTRLESEDRYSAIFQKVAEARPGAANNVFVQLGMYWQLHLAYDNADAPMDFYNQFFKLWKSGAYSGNDYDNRVALIASEVAQKDLTEFFTRWGMELTESTKSKLKSYGEEERAIWYLNDNSRRNRLEGTGVANGTLTLDSVTATNSVGSNGQDVTLTFSHTDGENILGYEILKDGKSIAFTTTGTFTEHIGTANNTVLTYSVRAVDKQGNISEATETQQVRISYDNVLDAGLYDLSQSGTTATVTMKNDKAQSVSGIKLTDVSDVESITAVLTTNVDGVSKETTLTLTQNMANDGSTFKAYFTKPGADAEDSRIWTYDITKLELQNVPEGASLQLIGAVNDDVAFLQDGAAIGRLLEAYQWGDTSEEVIPAGSLVIVGTYVGDPRYNYVQVNGEFTVRDLATGTETKETRPINGETYLLAEVPADGEVSLISNGMFIYVINEEAEGDLQNEHVDCDHPSSLPDRIQAVLYRTDNISETDGRITAQTMWISSPDADSMPSISLEHQ